MFPTIQDSTTILSPPMTPKVQWKKDHSASPPEEMLLPPTVAQHSWPVCRRKSVARAFDHAKAMVQDKDCYVLPVRTKFIVKRPPRIKTESYSRSFRKKPMSSSCFTMETVRPIPRQPQLKSPSPPSNYLSSSPLTPTPPVRRSIPTRKPKTDSATAVYDNVDLSVEDHTVFDDPDWIPSDDVFQKKPNIYVSWKGSPLIIHNMPYFERLHPTEAAIASTLRLTPEQYLKCKRALILTAQTYDRQHMAFRKSDAQKVCRIDVNKTSRLWCAFNRLGWFAPGKL